MSRFPGLRCQLCGIVLLLIVGDAVAAGAPDRDHARATQTSEAMEAEVRPLPHYRAPPSVPVCRRAPAKSFDVSLADAGWEKRLERIARNVRLGLAVGLGDRVAFAHDGTRARVPASNQKLLLSFALFDRFGPRYRIPTRAAVRTVDDGTVPGNLWVIGRGDPTLTAAEPGYWGDVGATTLADLARRIKWAGVTRIAGRVIGVIDYFAHDLDAPGWQPYVPGRYVQLPSSLVVNGNNAVRRSPERAAAAALTKQLERIDVRVEGPPGAGERPARLTRLAGVSSRPLAEIVASMNRSSNNFFAEVLGKLLGADVYGAPGTMKKGARAIEAWARAHGARVAANDSSGLSYKNRVAPVTVVELLRAAGSKRWGKALRAGLPAPGQGTLRNRLQGLDVRAKTGSLFDGTSALSGWVRSPNDRRWIEFSILGRSVPSAIEDRLVRVISGARIRVPARRWLRRCAQPSRTSETAPSTSGTRIRWRHSTALGTPTAGRLVNGVQLPAEGRHFFTWDPVTKSAPNRGYRRFGTDRLIRVVLGVLRAHAAKYPDTPRVGIGDLSHPNGGDFGKQFGGLGHSSHQNGLDVDVYYPRRDRREREPRTPRQIDRVLAQDLVDRFVRAGAVYVFVGPNTGLTGPPEIVQPLAHHDDHMHVRIRAKA